MRRYRINKNNAQNRNRKIAIFLGAIIITSIWLGTTGLLDGQALGNPDQYTKVVVKRGDTLWDIAKEYGHGSKDIRKTIYEIKSLNNLSDILIPGQVLVIPER